MIRLLNFVGNRGPLRVAQIAENTYIVVPVVALMEGVIHPINAPTPEFVTLESFADSAPLWENKPLIHTHPFVEGQAARAADPGWTEGTIGFTRNARVENKQLQMEAWIDPTLCVDVEQKTRVLGRALEGHPLEVSVGVDVGITEASGVYDDKPYGAAWTGKIKPDHLAMFGGNEIGACSVEMGCGTLRANMATTDGPVIVDRKQLAGYDDSQARDSHGMWTAGFAGTSGAKDNDRVEVMTGTHKGKSGRVKASIGQHRYVHDDTGSSLGFVHVSELTIKPRRAAEESSSMNWKDRLAQMMRTLMLAGESDVEMRAKLEEALRSVDADYKLNGGYIVQYTEKPGVLVYNMWATGGDKYWQRTFERDKEGAITLGARSAVEQKVSYQTLAAELPVEIPAPAAITEPEETERAACGCGGKSNQQPASPEEENVNREERIAALLKCAHNPVKSLKALQALDDNELAALETRTEELKTAAAKSTADSAALTAANEQIKTLQASMPKTETEWLAAAPAVFRDIVSDHRAAEGAEQAKLVERLKTAQSAFGEDELKAMPIAQLRKLGLAIPAPVAEPPVFAALGVPESRAAGSFDLKNFEAPDPWAAKH